MYPSVESVEGSLMAAGWTVERRNVPEWASVFVGGHVSLFATRGDACVSVDQSPSGWTVDGWDPGFSAAGVVRRAS